MPCTCPRRSFGLCCQLNQWLGALDRKPFNRPVVLEIVRELLPVCESPTVRSAALELPDLYPESPRGAPPPRASSAASPEAAVSSSV
jgi:hypothetical protein